MNNYKQEWKILNTITLKIDSKKLPQSKQNKQLKKLLLPLPRKSKLKRPFQSIRLLKMKHLLLTNQKSKQDSMLWPKKDIHSRN